MYISNHVDGTLLMKGTGTQEMEESTPLPIEHLCSKLSPPVGFVLRKTLVHDICM